MYFDSRFLGEGFCELDIADRERELDLKTNKVKTILCEAFMLL